MKRALGRRGLLPLGLLAATIALAGSRRCPRRRTPAANRATHGKRCGVDVVSTSATASRT